jgi:hypothetical protein
LAIVEAEGLHGERAPAGEAAEALYFASIAGAPIRAMPLVAEGVAFRALGVRTVLGLEAGQAAPADLLRGGTPSY